MPGNKKDNIISAAVLKVLRPLIRLLLRKNIPYGAFADMAKRIYVDTAMMEFTLKNKKPSISSAAIVTGLSRKEVSRVSRLPDPDDSDIVSRYNRAARVISGWIRDPRFSTSGMPKILPMDGENSFSELARSFSGDIPAKAMLNELKRVSAVEILDDQVRLTRRAYLPETDEDDKIAILGEDVSRLIAAIDHNLTASPGRAYFQRKVHYDNIPIESLDRIRNTANQHAQLLLERLDAIMSRSDRDVNPNIKGTDRKEAMLGIYYYEDDVES